MNLGIAMMSMSFTTALYLLSEPTISICSHVSFMLLMNVSAMSRANESGNIDTPKSWLVNECLVLCLKNQGGWLVVVRFLRIVPTFDSSSAVKS